MARSQKVREQYAEEAHAINARDMDFHWEHVPLHYIPGQMVATHVYSVMHMILPEGEKAMSKALADALPLIDDPRLHEAVVGFIGQEATHADNHEGVQERLADLGLDFSPVLNRLSRLIEIIMVEYGDEKVRHQLLCERLALFSALEHFTAVWGKFFLESEGLAESGIDPMILDLLRWHGAEEVEHRSVVFDAFQYVDGSYGRRVRQGIIGTTFLFAAGMVSLGYLVAQDPVRKQSRNPYRRYVAPLVELARAQRDGVIPNIFGGFTELPTYLRPGFHPSQLDGMDLAVRYLANAPIKAS
jgi:uncharacterized protein